MILKKWKEFWQILGGLKFLLMDFRIRKFVEGGYDWCDYISFN